MKLTSSIIPSISYQKCILQRTYIILEKFDLVIVDGSITESVIDRDATGHDFKVLICKKMILEVQGHLRAQS